MDICKPFQEEQQQGQSGGNILVMFKEEQGGSCGVSGIIFLFTFRVVFLVRAPEKVQE